MIWDHGLDTAVSEVVQVVGWAFLVRSGPSLAACEQAGAVELGLATKSAKAGQLALFARRGLRKPAGRQAKRVPLILHQSLEPPSGRGCPSNSEMCVPKEAGCSGQIDVAEWPVQLEGAERKKLQISGNRMSRRESGQSDTRSRSSPCERETGRVMENKLGSRVGASSVSTRMLRQVSQVPAPAWRAQSQVYPSLL